VKNLPRVVQGHCHRLRQGIPYLPAGPRPGWGARTSSSSGGTMVGGPVGFLPLVGPQQWGLGSPLPPVGLLLPVGL
jgi:hypothetical protein